jgi:hypothetical protein
MLDELATALDDVCDADPHSLAEPATLLQLHRLLTRLDAAVTRAAGAFDASRAWEADGARSAAAWMARRCHEPAATAHRRVRMARALRHLPAVEEAWIAGDITGAHAGLIAGARTETTATALERDEPMLVDHARRLAFHHLVRVVRYWRQCADPDGVEVDAAHAHGLRRAHLSHSLGGMWYGDLVLDPVGGTIVAGELRRLEEQMFEHDWAEARQQRGDGATVADLPRTPGQRRADAIVEMARRSATMPADGRAPRPLFTVLVGYETFAGRVCELANQTVVAPGSLVPWLSEADIERVVFAGPSRVIDVGERRRLFTGATRRAVEVRDRECFHEYCDRPAGECEIDHVRPWSTGGPTTSGNGRPACPLHHRDRHGHRRRRP